MVRKKCIPKKTENADAEDTSNKSKQPNSGTSIVAPFDVNSASTSSSSGFVVNDGRSLHSFSG